MQSQPRASQAGVYAAELNPWPTKSIINDPFMFLFPSWYHPFLAISLCLGFWPPAYLDCWPPRLCPHLSGLLVLFLVLNYSESRKQHAWGGTDLSKVVLGGVWQVLCHPSSSPFSISGVLPARGLSCGPGRIAGLHRQGRVGGFSLLVLSAIVVTASAGL